MSQSKLTYEQSGVDYAKIDPLKVLAQQAAMATGRNTASAGVTEVVASRGESAYVMDVGDFYIACITECLGTKALVADSIREITGKTYYDYIAQDTIATAVNDQPDSHVPIIVAARLHVAVTPHPTGQAMLL